MTFNYFDSVQANGFNDYQAKEQAPSLSDLLYSWGDKLSQKSGMYRGKAYELRCGQVGAYGSYTTVSKTSENAAHSSPLQKLEAIGGYCLKGFAGCINKKIKARHLLAHELAHGSHDSNLIETCRAIIWNESTRLNAKKSTKGEGEFNFNNPNVERDGCAATLVICCTCCAEICKQC